MKSRFTTNLAVLLFTCSTLLYSCDDKRREVIVWKIDSTNKIGENVVIVSGNPQVISGENGNAVEFDGVDDGLLIDHNPIAGMQEFTIEVDLKPYRAGMENREQRFLHIQDPENVDRRILLELRLNERDEWYGDWFVKTEKRSLTLIDTLFTHPLEEWATMSLEYKNGTVTGFVNGIPEVSGEIEYLPVGPEGKTSIGTRMDQRSWFKGAIKEVRFLPKTSNQN
ncbi:MAG: LamG-like jellyroll fold domain-containing protein [Bacteroidota bacterium]